MGFGDASLFLKITFILLILALIIQILGLALPYWYEYEISDVDSNGGLFRACSSFMGTTICANYKSNVDWLNATQAMEIIGLLCIVGALVVCIIVLFVKSDMKVLKLICWILSFCAFAFIIIGVIIYGAEASDFITEHLSGAFAITVIAAIICLVCGILALIDWMGKGQ